MPRITRPGAISSSAPTVIATTTGCLVKGLSAPSATRMPGTWAAIAEA
jgi:hypothetical protein